ncbi:hypothetical protein [Evansella vedderi]|nr:hypothetical protein [Evansella vedderi]
MMKVVECKVNQIGLTVEEYERFKQLKYYLNRTISPNDAKFYKKELDLLVAKGRRRLIEERIGMIS